MLGIWRVEVDWRMVGNGISEGFWDLVGSWRFLGGWKLVSTVEMVKFECRQLLE
jgi:hypothetical protein